MKRRWTVLAVVLGGLLAALALLASTSPSRAEATADAYYETFTQTTYLDLSRTTALWDTAAGELRLHPPVPGAEGVAAQLYYPTAWSGAVYVSETDRVYLFSGKGGSQAIQEYDLATNTTWKLALELPHELYGPAVVYAESRHAVYLFGGAASRDVVRVTMGPGPVSATVLASKLPGPLFQAAAAYAPDRDKVYLFGGVRGDGLPSDAIWEYNLATGLAVTLPVTLPTPSAFSAAVYDPQTDSAFLFGGRLYNLPLTAVVKFDVAQQTVTRLASLPQASSGMSAVYDPASGKAYVFGGLGVSGPLSYTLQFDPLQGRVTALTADALLARYGTAAVCVPSHAAAYLFGGVPDYYGLLTLADVVSFDFNTHTAAEWSSGVDGRAGASAVYVPTSHKAYLFGGQSVSELSSQRILAFDVQGARLQPVGATLPVSRTDTAAVYDAAANRAYIFGGARPGSGTPYFADIQRFNPVDESLSAAGAALPSARAGMAAVYVPSKGRAYLFGGVDGSGCLDQIVAYDLAQDRVTVLPGKLPTPVAYAAVVYDAATNKAYLFGGWNPSAAFPYLNQVVAFDVASETATLLSAKLTARGKASAFSIPGEGRAYIVGGAFATGFHLDDIWSFDATTLEITRVMGIELGVPRSAAAAVYVPEKARAYLFGGTGHQLDEPLGDIVALKLAYPLSQTAQSQRVNAAGTSVHQARLTAEQSQRSGAVLYWLSNDGGAKWAQVVPGQRYIFPAAGSDLRWKALLSGNGDTTPVVQSLTITYNGLEEYRVFLPVTVRKAIR